MSIELIHKKFIESQLKGFINKYGTIYVGNNLNEFLIFKKIEDYINALKTGKSLIDNDYRTKKSSADITSGRLAEEIIVYLLDNSFKEKKYKYDIVYRSRGYEKYNEIFDSLGILEPSKVIIKKYDCDIIIVNKNKYYKEKNLFIISSKGTVRERIGQFISHLFLMDQDVLDIKYGKNKYKVLFKDKGMSVKYGLVIFDWAKNRDFDKFTKKDKDRVSSKEVEAKLIYDDKRYGSGIYVLNNYEHLDYVRSFEDLINDIHLFLQ